MSKTPEKTPQIVKDVYNEHLVVTRTFHGKPFKLKKNFDNFHDDDRFEDYYRMSIWFERHPEINRKMFFEALLYFNRDKQAIHIKHYMHPRSLTTYTRYKKLLNSMDLSSSDILRNSIESWKFLSNYCEEKNLSIGQYLKHIEDGSITKIWMKHVKEGKILIYNLFAFTDFYDTLKILYRDRDLWGMYLGQETPLFFLERWNSSDTFKTLSNRALSKIIQKLNTN